MLTTMTFVTLFRFVVWTIPSLSGLPSSLYTFYLAIAWLGIPILQGSPNLTDSTKSLQKLIMKQYIITWKHLATLQKATMQAVVHVEKLLQASRKNGVLLTVRTNLRTTSTRIMLPNNQED